MDRPTKESLHSSKKTLQSNSKLAILFIVQQFSLRATDYLPFYLLTYINAFCFQAVRSTSTTHDSLSPLLVVAQFPIWCDSLELKPLTSHTSPSSVLLFHASRVQILTFGLRQHRHQLLGRLADDPPVLQRPVLVVLVLVPDRLHLNHVLRLVVARTRPVVQRVGRVAFLSGSRDCFGIGSSGRSGHLFALGAIAGSVNSFRANRLFLDPRCRLRFFEIVNFGFDDRFNLHLCRGFYGSDLRFNLFLFVV